MREGRDQAPRVKDDAYVIRGAVRRVYAEVDHHTFDAFAQRCRSERVDIGAALSELVRQYSKGAMLTNVDRPKKKTGADYLGEHERGEA